MIIKLSCKLKRRKNICLVNTVTEGLDVKLIYLDFFWDITWKKKYILCKIYYVFKFQFVCQIICMFMHVEGGAIYVLALPSTCIVSNNKFKNI